MVMIWKTARGAVPLATTAIMGILNITPDSFSDGGCYLRPEDAAARAAAMRREGADVIDIGGQSTRPGHVPVTAEEEWARLAPVISAVVALGVPVSVDTYYPLVAARALAAGAAAINDVSGALSEEMFTLAASHGAGMVYTFNDTAAGDVVARAASAFSAACALADRTGLPPEALCLDVGVGFHSTRDDDHALIRRHGELTAAFPAHPFLVGISRKRVTDPTGILPPPDRLPASIALQTAAQLGGAHILRVHDVAPAKQAAAAIDRLKGAL